MPITSNSAPHDEQQVYVLDDDPAVQRSLRSLLRSVGLNALTFNSFAEFSIAPKLDVPSCLVLDVRLPGIDGLGIQAELAKTHMPLPIIFITGYGDILMAVRAMKAGAVEFLPKPFREQDLLDAVRQALDRDRARRDCDLAQAQLRSAYQKLTPREQEVLRLVVSGMMSKQIAYELGISEITVKVHRGNIMHKMGARSQATLARMAVALRIPDRPQITEARRSCHPAARQGHAPTLEAVMADFRRAWDKRD
jgi:FixJ family two-component response regulator